MSKPYSPVMRVIGTPVIYIATSGADILGFLALLFMLALGGKRLFTYGGAVIMELDKTRWFTRTFYAKWGGSTFAPHMIMINDGRGSDLIDAELRHGEQMTSEAFEKLAIGAAMMTVGVVWWLPAIWWALGGLIAIVMAMWTALLRGEHPYYSSHLETGAHPRYRDREHDH